MTAAVRDLVIARCESCHGRFLPRPGPCPRCGSTSVIPQPIPPTGEILAATELMVPATGWPAPHRIALVGLSEEVRVLAEVDGPLPEIGSFVTVEPLGDRYRVRTGGPPPTSA
ncbi:MAG TPA: hypothetical protein VGS18_01340 [Thermoplasmata archaeon]|nr:hypothetical protein [Thermoplasmata archaeon]